MSISKIQELLNKKGCIWTVSILTLLGIVGGSFFQCNRADRVANQMERRAGTPIAEIGGQAITDSVLDEQIQFADQQSPPSPGTTGLEMATHSLENRVSAIENLVNDAILLEIAKKYGVTVSDDDVIKGAEAEFKGRMDMAKQQFIAMQKLKQNATDDDFNKVYKEMTGTDPKEKLETGLEDIKSRLKTPDSRMPLIAQMATQPILEAIKKGLKVTDDEVKKGRDQFELKRIVISKNDVQAVAKKAIADLKGGMGFEAAITRYSNDNPEPGKKLADTTSHLTRNQIEQSESIKSLLNLKPGEYSEPISLGQSVAIFKLISIKPDIPKDFDKKKDTYRDTALTGLAAAKLQQEQKDAKKTVAIKWKNEADRVVYEYGEIQTDTTPGKEQRERLMKLVEDAQKAGSDKATIGTNAGRGANLVAFVVLRGLSENASAEEKTKLDALKVEVYHSYLDDNEDVGTRLELAQIYLAKKAAADFTEQLTMAANANIGHPDVAGQSVYNEINKLLKQGQDAKLLKDADVKTIEDDQRAWVDAKVDKDKQDAEDKKQAEAAEKQRIEDEKKAKAEEAAKKAADAKKPKGPSGSSLLTPTNPTTGTTTTGTTTAGTTTGGTAPTGKGK